MKEIKIYKLWRFSLSIGSEITLLSYFDKHDNIKHSLILEYSQEFYGIRLVRYL